MARSAAASVTSNAADVRDKILNTASDLFYKLSVRAVGVDLVVEKAGVAKTSLYRHFGTKDDLVAAFLKGADDRFWTAWDAAARPHEGNPRAQLDAILGWIGEKAGNPTYRGCPQINVAAEFPEPDHPARKVAKEHKREMRQRLKGIAEGLDVADPDMLAGQLSLLINGAFVSPLLFKPKEATPMLRHAAAALIAGAR
jgi:AcrR family transcriptional regulator